MIVFIAGAAGAIRRPLVQQLVSAGHGWSAQLDPRRSSDTSAPLVPQASSCARDSDALRRAIITASPMSSSTSSPTWHDRTRPFRSATRRISRCDLAFSPVYPDWRDGLRAELAPAAPGQSVQRAAYCLS